MKMKYKYIRFRKCLGYYEIISNSQGVVLGTIEWYKVWKQFCFIPKDNCIFSRSCMLDIADFLDQLQKERPYT